ncbi:LytR/AlgR family response regulator transcription factor [Portibacter lacus]|uniref:DNA-binding response regulator n=1 Tax=Portibacter lacus TaxID=1099794 RepID=A0AA37WGG5_9BACT|nr:LytTR family DNA-binding domain-containing protein [Portibacter lacus]GLR18329.1 DNA-binding response regulator [Portibacter lacus]
MINVIIVDDEPLALDVLETFINQLPNINLLQKCENAFEANEAIKKHDVDLLFLDIQMPQLTGIDFYKSLTNPPEVIFTTAYSNYAVEGFEMDAIDYLVKPISLDRFMKAVNKATEKIGNKSEVHVGSDDEDFIFVKADKKLVKVNYNDILYIEGLKDYVIIRMKTGRVITLQTMKSLESKLPERFFKRIHRSYILGLNQIQAIVGNTVEIIENGKTKQLPIGKNYREELLEIVNQNRL